LVQDELQEGLIITDTYSKRPLFDFPIYSQVIVKMIKNSDPNFCVGVYGEWGTGKTTFMKLIKKGLEDKEDDKENIITVWFDAWKYENQEQFALIPLLKTIIYSIEDTEDPKKRKLKDVLREAAIFTIGVSSEVVSSVIAKYAGEKTGELSKIGLNKIEDRLTSELPNLKRLSDIDSNGIFYNGIRRIQEAIDKIKDVNPKFRIIIFIDDLDRCSEDKVLEILESMKIFLSLNGIIYVLGISYERIVELITKKYGGDRNEEYLKKFVQIPITLSEWNEVEIGKLIDDLLLNKVIHADYQMIIQKYKRDIASVVQDNPRELKRFLNNLIITYEAYKLVAFEYEQVNEVFLQQLLLVQILKSQWKDVYTSMSNSNGKILEGYDNYIPQNESDRAKLLSEDSPLDQRLRSLLDKYKKEEKLWDFIGNNYTILTNIPWDIFRRVTNFTSESYQDPNIQAIKLLKSGEISKFNEARSKLTKFANLDLSGSDLSDSNLESANLRKLILRNTKLERSKLYFTSFSGSDLTEARMQRANLLESSFTLSKLFGADFSDVNTDLPHQDRTSYDTIYDIDLSKSNLSEANFSGAKLQYAVIVSPESFDGMIVNEETDFSYAVIDDPEFIEYLKKYTTKVPSALTSKEELRRAFNERDFDQKRIDFLLSLSKRPWKIKVKSGSHDSK